jgi:periplasmic protein TonB
MILQGASDWESAAVLTRRRLYKALAVSAVVHCVVLWPGALPKAPLATAQPLSVTLRERPAAEVVRSALTEAKTREMPVQARQSDPSVRKRVSERSIRKALLATAPALNTPRVQSTRPTLATPAPRGDTAVSTGQASAPSASHSLSPPSYRGAEGGPEPRDGLDVGALRDYRFAVVRVFRKRYPPLAVERGWTGTAQVRLTVGPEGEPREVTVVGTSGHAVLDAEARTSIAMAARIAELPAALMGHRFDVELPVEFRLDEFVSHH